MDAGEQNFGSAGIHFQMNNGQGPGPVDAEPRDIWNTARMDADDPHRTISIGESSQTSAMHNIQRAKRQNCGNIPGQYIPFLASSSQDGPGLSLMNVESEGNITQQLPTCFGSQGTRYHHGRHSHFRQFASGSLEAGNSIEGVARETYRNEVLPGPEVRLPHAAVGGSFISSNYQPHLGDISCKRKSSMMDISTDALNIRTSGERYHDHLRFPDAPEVTRADNGSTIFPDSAPVILEQRNRRGNENIYQPVRMNSVHFPQGSRNHIRNVFGSREICQVSVGMPNNSRSSSEPQTWVPRRNDSMIESAGRVDMIPAAEPLFINQNLGPVGSIVWSGHGNAIGQGNNNNPAYAGAISRDLNSGDVVGSHARHYTGGSSNWVGSECTLQNTIEQPNRAMASLTRTLPVRDVGLNVPHVLSNTFIYPGSFPSRSSPYPHGAAQTRRNAGGLLPFPSAGCAANPTNIQRSQATYGEGHPSFPPLHGPAPPMYPGSVEGARGMPLPNLYRVPIRGVSVIPTESVNRHLRFSNHDLVDHSQVRSSVDIHDQHSNMRLDVDNMSYEELLALEERIGNVNTGLSEDIIKNCVKATKYSSLHASWTTISLESEVKCSICQEEYIAEDEIGKLECGHCYHTACIKEWLMLKNLCPICKASAYTAS